MTEENNLEESKRDANQTGDRDRRDRETMSKINKALSELKVLLEVITYLGIKAEDEQGKETITSAVDNVKAGNLEKAKDSLNESCEFLKAKIDKTIEKELEKMETQAGLKEEGKGNQEIERAISKLKKSKENNEYEDLPDLFFQAWDKVKKS
ncbi:MAG: hypothetical protein V5A66_02040 [Candidatus Thermoplasmatota archaeon]